MRDARERGIVSGLEHRGCQRFAPVHVESAIGWGWLGAGGRGLGGEAG